MRFEDLINSKTGLLTKNDIQILSYLLKNRESISHMTSKELSELTFTSPATLTRISKKLDFNGLSEMKYFLRHERDISQPERTDYFTALEKDMKDTMSLLSQTDLQPLVKAIHEARHIYLYGTDWGEKRACELLARNFIAVDQRMYAIPSITELKWALDTVGSEDLLIVISFSGENQEINNHLMRLHVKNVTLISITPLSQNSLSSQATFNLYYVSTRLHISNIPDTEYNYFSCLEFVVDALFRYYIDTYH
ncbi:MAG: MurR/RpiR family transcriptional regulator [Lactobacillus sp.]|jgi:RpiR family glv operon transcriptional regulator|nr:MurR/RpiR family transcriptional regulator [Lactobacillus sp.]